MFLATADIRDTREGASPCRSQNTIGGAGVITRACAHVIAQQYYFRTRRTHARVHAFLYVLFKSKWRISTTQMHCETRYGNE